MDTKETGMLLARISLVDNRQASVETIRVWQEILVDTDYEDAVEAVIRHWRTSDQWIKPVHIVEGAKIVNRERRKKTYGRLE